MTPSRYPTGIIRERQIAWRTPGICPVALADKLKAIQELRQPALAEAMEAEPRIVDALWFLQWQSHQPGGLDQFSQRLILEHPERLRTKEMAKIGWPRDGRYTVEEAIRIFRSLPALGKSAKAILGVPCEEDMLSLMGGFGRDRDPGYDPEIAYLMGADAGELRKIDPERHAGAARLLSELTPEKFWQVCAEVALTALPGKLVALCTSLEDEFASANALVSAWYFDDLLSALLQTMDHHAETARKSIADTSVSRDVRDRLSFAIEMRANVLLAGDARLGKSVTFQTECRARPGIVRLVTVPAEKSPRAFYEAHANAFRYAYTSRIATGELEAAVKHVVSHGGLFLAYDEFHFAIPEKARPGQTPFRLDWVRCNVVDRDIGVVFCTTRQAYGRALSEFVANTKWAIEQWAGRIHDTKLFGIDAEDPNSAPPLNEEDVLAIAANKFPAVPREILEEIACVAYGTATAPHAVTAILKAALWLARKAGRSVPTSADAARAVKEWEAQPAHESFENVQGPPPIPKATATDNPGAKVVIPKKAPKTSRKRDASKLQVRRRHSILPDSELQESGSRLALETA